MKEPTQEAMALAYVLPEPYDKFGGSIMEFWDLRSKSRLVRDSAEDICKCNTFKFDQKSNKITNTPKNGKPNLLVDLKREREKCESTLSFNMAEINAMSPKNAAITLMSDIYNAMHFTNHGDASDFNIGVQDAIDNLINLVVFDED